MFFTVWYGIYASSIPKDQRLFTEMSISRFWAYVDEEMLPKDLLIFTNPRECK